MEERAEELQCLLWAASGHGDPSQYISSSPSRLLQENRLAPYNDILSSDQPLLTWPHFEDTNNSTTTSGCCSLRMPAALWVVMLEEKAENNDPVLMRHVVWPLHDHLCRVEMKKGAEVVTTTPLQWVLFLRCQNFSLFGPQIGLLSLERLLHLGTDPNEPLHWTRVGRQVGRVGVSPLNGMFQWWNDSRQSLWDTLELLLRFNARFDPSADRDVLNRAMSNYGVEDVLQFFRPYSQVLRSVQPITTRRYIMPNYQCTTPLHVLAAQRLMDSPGAVADAQFLHEMVDVSLLTLDRNGFTALQVAKNRILHKPSDEWARLIVYLEDAEAAEWLEVQKRMTLAAFCAMLPLSPELRELVGKYLPPGQFLLP